MRSADTSTREWAAANAGFFEHDDESFGASLALENRMLVVGAPRDGAEGSVTIYPNFATASEQQSLSAEAGSVGFGSEVALHDDVLLVGARGNSTLRAAVFLYHFRGNLRQAQLACSIREPDSMILSGGLGSKGSMAVTKAGDSYYLVLGAHGDGVAHVVSFAPGGEGQCSYMQGLRPRGWLLSDRFGAAVSIASNSLVIVGAPGYSRQWHRCPSDDCIDGVIYFRAMCWAAQRQRCAGDKCLRDRHECNSASCAVMPPECAQASITAENAPKVIDNDDVPIYLLPAPAIVECGNAKREALEDCDDGGYPPSSGDGCSQACTVELGFLCGGGSFSSADGCALDPSWYGKGAHVRGALYFENLSGMLTDAQNDKLKKIFAENAVAFNVRAAQDVVVEGVRPARRRAGQGSVSVGVRVPSGNDEDAVKMLAGYKEAIEQGAMTELIQNTLDIPLLSIRLTAYTRDGTRLASLNATQNTFYKKTGDGTDVPPQIGVNPPSSDDCSDFLLCYGSIFLGVGLGASGLICTAAIFLCYKHRVCRSCEGLFASRRQVDERDILASIQPSSQTERDRRLAASMASSRFGGPRTQTAAGPNQTEQAEVTAEVAEARAALGLSPIPTVATRATGPQLLGGARHPTQHTQHKTGKLPVYAQYRKQMIARQAAAAAQTPQHHKICNACILNQPHDKCVWVYPDLHQLAEEGNVDMYERAATTKPPKVAKAEPTGPSPAGAQGSGRGTVEEKECLICLGGFGPGDQIRVLPCMHTFHKSCVDEWLGLGHNDCPLCKQVVDDPSLKVNSEFKQQVEQRLGVDLSSAAAGPTARQQAPRAGRRPVRELLGEGHGAMDPEIGRPQPARLPGERGERDYRRERGGRDHVERQNNHRHQRERGEERRDRRARRDREGGGHTRSRERDQGEGQGEGERHHRRSRERSR